MKKSTCVAVSCLAFLGCCLTLPAASAPPGANWPAWRGPDATGASTTATPPTTWSETNHLKWKVQIPGAGTATPIIWDNQIFIQTAVRTGKKAEEAKQDESPGQNPGGRPGRGGSEKPGEIYRFVLMSIDRATGKTTWEKTAREELPHEGHHPDHGFSSCSPITDGEFVFAYFGSRGLHCFDLKGNLKWQKDLGKMRTKNSFGEGGSPALFGETLVIKWDHEGEDFIAAFDRKTGNELWRTSRDEDTSWSTPLILSHNGKAQVITTATKRIRSYDLATGKQIWEGPALTPNAIPSPVAANGVVYAMSGFRGNAAYAIRLGREGDLSSSDAILWSAKKGTPYVPSPLLTTDKLYFFAGNNGMLSCLDAKTGQPLIDSERIETLQGVYASPVEAAGRVYLVGRNGVTVVIKDSGKLEILATNRLDERIDASPALAGKDLVLRGHENLYCLSDDARP
jgi:outer membrane protein assembly factor BamB